MLQREVFEYFKLYFPQFAEHVTEWFPNGKNSIRVRQSNGQDFIFTYNGKKDWCFETVRCFLERVRKERKQNDKH